MKVFKRIFLSAVLMVGFKAMADDSIYMIQGKAGTKLDALSALIRDKDAQVLKCQPQMITKKATLKKKGSDNE